MTTQPITQAELESYLWGAATLLRGYIDAGDYKQFIFPLIFWKRMCDVYDEETLRAKNAYGQAFPEDHRFQIPAGAHWNEVRAITANVGMAMQQAMRDIETANQEMLEGIFGDAPWTNKERLSDATLRDLIEHFSREILSTARASEDLLGQAYEFLIKKFADDSGHTAAEFYTNRTVVHLMTRMLEPQPHESVYDPTCGSGGMLLSAALELKNNRDDTLYRTLKLYGQEINLMTSAMARMNLFMHGFEDFQIKRGDTLARPLFIDGDRLQQFDIILANPPYSIKQWNRDAFANDPYGRNIYGTPPQGRADYAFFQHIIASLKAESGRCAILFPHGVLFRDEEQKMRELMIKDDVFEAVIGLGPNLFYNSSMTSCIVVCSMNKPPERKNKILFINAVQEVTRERAFSHLEDKHIQKISGAYRDFQDIDGFARVVDTDEIASNNYNLNIPQYVLVQGNNGFEASEKPLDVVIQEWQESSTHLRQSMNELFETLKDAGLNE
jgi:type I restriction enzyme M protein